MLKRIQKLNKGTILFFIIVGLIFVQTLFFAPQDIEDAAKSEHQSTKKTLENQRDQNRKAVEQKLVGIHLVENSNNQKGWDLKADEATGSSDDQWVLKKVRIEFFSENKSSYIVTGDAGEIDGQSKNIQLRGKVITQTVNGYQFFTNDLVYDAKEKKLKSKDQVQMIGPDDKNGSGFKLEGLGFAIDMVTSKMKILSQVTANKQINKKQFNVSSTSAEFSNKNQEALFDGLVQMNFDTSKISAPQAFFKYNEAKKGLESITLQDKVMLKDFDKEATCEQLVMNLFEDSMVLKGRPKVQMGEDEIAGEEITFLEGGKKVKMKQVKIDSKKVN